MDTYVVIVLIFGVITLVLFILLFFVNRMFLLRNRIEDSFIPIKDYLQERVNILDSMIAFLVKYLKYEEEFKIEMKNERDLLEGVEGALDGVVLLKDTEGVLVKFVGLGDIYSKIRKNKEYLSLIEQYQENRDRINYAIDSYNKGVRDYNNYRKLKIISFLDKIFHFPVYIYYKSEL